MLNLGASSINPGTRRTKQAIKKDLQTAIDTAHAECKARIASMSEASDNPQVAAMIERNKGYMSALEDVTELLYSRRIF